MKPRLRVPAFIAVLSAILATLVVMNFVTGDKTVKRKISSQYGVDDPQFLRSMGSLLGPAIVGGNRTEELLNGDQIFPAMLTAIRGAQQSISFETYIYWSGTIGKEFSEAFAERARAGVPVHVILDWVGAGKIDQGYLEAMTRAGVQVERYHPLRWYNLGRLNNRTHRKLLIVDGRIGFTGGVGIGDKWLGHAQSPDHWRDSHFRVEGPVVAELQAAFMDNWLKTRGEVLHGDRYFPLLQPAGTDFCQVFKSSAGEGSENVRLMYLLSIASAKKSIRIANAYFVPDDLTVDTLLAARKRGVTIDVILPGKEIDAETTRNASRSRWGPLLDAGVRIYEYQPTMYHCKVMIVDEDWVSVGSTNFDSRSFRLNDEANLNVFNRAFALRQVMIFRDDQARSREVTAQMWRQRPLSEKLKERLASLMRSQL